MQNQLLPDSLREQIYNDRKIRTAITTKNHLMFFNVYFGNYVKYQTARLHKEMFTLTEDDSIKLAIIVAFRGSGKSTIMTLSYPLWAILGEQQKKFVLILSQTQRQARQHLVNLKRELESNALLRSDLGPFKEETDEWGALALVIPKYNARIMAASTEQSVRGLRHGEHRPDLIICDDIEDLESVKTKEGRDKTHQWLTGDVIPSGDQNTRVVIVGNLLHEDSLLMRLKAGIADGEMDGIYRNYPLLDDKNNIAWLGMYPTMAHVETARRKIGNEASWHREYLLHIISDSERVVHPEWIHYYTELPPDRGQDIEFSFAATGIDLAVSQKTTADYTAMVSARVYTQANGYKIYILPNPVNEHLTFPQTIEKIKSVSKMAGGGRYSKIIVEQVGYQEAVIQQLHQDSIAVEGFKVGGSDKRERIAVTTAAIQSGKILFPKKGAEALLSQLTGFGIEKHDDLADAFAIVINSVLAVDYRRGDSHCLAAGEKRSRHNQPYSDLPRITMDTIF
jgi:predicted phage terminase large subunit-like protein